MPPPKQSYLVLVDNFTDDGVLRRRQEARRVHLDREATQHELGELVSAGETLDSHESGGILGSALVVNATSPEEVMEMLKFDPYWDFRVWNLDTAKILPYKGASF
ncbi:hypothetical protein LPJ61_005730 [Coemansia biformis]|uniref:YCII-related domain-containing protein n=1 Tax=Coemansia biformis TaxID=1286918 RepID=A0A9W7Y4H9_9FUNG|nr:hypothetical protein LPJ61_005730 [Coemansia biformis]